MIFTHCKWSDFLESELEEAFRDGWTAAMFWSPPSSFCSYSSSKTSCCCYPSLLHFHGCSPSNWTSLDVATVLVTGLQTLKPQEAPPRPSRTRAFRTLIFKLSPRLFLYFDISSTAKNSQGIRLQLNLCWTMQGTTGEAFCWDKECRFPM